MYKYLKMMQPLAEEIGQVDELKMHNNSPYWDNGVEISGRTADGYRFELNLTFQKEKKDES